MLPGYLPGFVDYKRVAFAFAVLALACVTTLPGNAVAQSVPAPFIDQPVLPTAVPPGGPGFTLTVDGGGFVSGSVVLWNGSPRVTTFVSAARLTAAILATDIAVAGTATVTVANPGSTYKSNTAALSIADPRTALIFSTGSPIQGDSNDGVVVADFNGDGVPDVVGFIIPANQNTASLCIQIGNADATFKSPNCFATFASENGQFAYDFNSDGKLDLLVASGRQLFVFLGNGDGSFQAPQVTVLADDPQNLPVAGDFNGDGKADLVVTLGSALNVSFLAGNGDGTFAAGTSIASGVACTLAGDFDGDGKLDLACSDSSISGNVQIGVLKGHGDGTFQALPEAPTGEFRADLVYAADFDGDGKLDALVSYVANDPGGTKQASTGSAVFHGVGDGTFGPLSNGCLVTIAAVADINGDGLLDIVSTDSRLGAPSTEICFGDQAGHFASVLDFSTFHPIGAADFTRDGKVDLIAFDLADNQLHIFEQQLAPGIQLSASSLDFGIQPAGSTHTQAVIVTNTGQGVLHISNLSIRNLIATDFALNETCDTPVQPNGTCQINVSFTPTAFGAITGSISFNDDASEAVQQISLQGTGTASSTPTISPSNVAFSMQFVGASSGSQMVTVRNTTATSLNIGNVASNSTDFGVVSSCPAVLNSLATCSIAVSFNPASSGLKNGVLTIADSASNSPVTIDLTGTAEDFSIAASSQSATITAGQTASYALSIASGGGFSQKVSFACSGAPAQAMCTVSPNTLTLGSTPGALNVTVTTTASSFTMPRSIPQSPMGSTPGLLWFLFLTLFALFVWQSYHRRRRLTYALLLLALICMGMTMSACGGGSSQMAATGTPQGTFTLMVTGTFTSGSTTLTRSTNLTLVVK